MGAEYKCDSFYLVKNISFIKFLIFIVQVGSADGEINVGVMDILSHF